MVDVPGKYYDGHYSHARMIQKLLSFEVEFERVAF